MATPHGDAATITVAGRSRTHPQLVFRCPKDNHVAVIYVAAQRISTPISHIMSGRVPHIASDESV
jgi:hypothetical protein